MLERLDPRTLFATISGTVFGDVDSSTTFDSDEEGTRAATVYLDSNANGRYDAGEPQKVTTSAGRYTFKRVAAGDVLVGVLPPAGQGETAPGRYGSVKGGFDIELTGIDALTAVERKAFADAAARWESIITGDLPDVGTIDDVRIDVTIDRIDGRGDTLAQAGPNDYRRGSLLPYTGDMEFDEADIAGLIAEGHFIDTVTHEMGHVLGFGTIWDQKGLVGGSGSRHPTFRGRAANREYDRLFGVTSTAVPIESGGGDGTAEGHWSEDLFVEELMTGYDESRGTAEPLSRITAASFADLGYAVNLDAADGWDPIEHTTVVTTPLDVGARAFERRVTVTKDGIVGGVDFGLRADTGPVIGRLTASDGTLGEAVTLSASGLDDAEDDAVVGVTFYGESNGVAGLQGGRGGDTYLGSASSSQRGAWTVAAPTGALAAGTQTYYAVASDALGLAARKATTATLTAPPPPTRPNPVVATRQSKSSTLLQWRDRSNDEIGFRVEYSADPDYATILRAFNVPAGTGAALIDGLTHAVRYYARVRAYGYGGASAYTRLSGVRV